MSDERVPIESIKRLTMVLGERCRVVSETTSESRTLTITTEEGTICTFTGPMDFSWVIAP